MKTLRTEFEANYDKSGKMKFTQLRREGDVALYHRTRPDSSTFNYEVFIVKTAKAGTALPNGAVEAEDRERYPGADAFGRYAYDCSTLEAAEKKFNELLVKADSLAEAREESDRTGKRVRAKKVINVIKVKSAEKNKEGMVSTEDGRKGRKSVDRTQFVFPDGEWSMKQAHALNPSVCHATIWTYAKQLVKSGDLIVCGQLNGGRGKATLLYRFVTSAEKLNRIDRSDVKDGTPF